MSQVDQAAELFKAMAHPLRLSIVLELTKNPMTVSELAEFFEVPQPTMSQQLKILHSARILDSRRIGRQVVYRVVDHHIAHIAGDAVNHVTENPAPAPEPIVTKE